MLAERKLFSVFPLSGPSFKTATSPDGIYVLPDRRESFLGILKFRFINRVIVGLGRIRECLIL